MSTENSPDTADNNPVAEAADPEGSQLPEVIFDKTKDQVTIVDPKGQSLTFRTRVIEEEPEEDEEEEREPMTPEEFQEALGRIDKLGLTWTADLVPSVKAKTPENEASFASEEFQGIQKKYPHLPFEIHLAASYALTGNKAGEAAAGGAEYLEKKAAIVAGVLIDSDYRSEFFFKYAIKVPYLNDIDWEVVYKLYEKGIKGVPGVYYGMLALSLQDPFYTGRMPGPHHITVAVDEKLVNKLLGIFNQVKSSLENARRLSDVLNNQQLLEEQDHDNDKPKAILGQ